MRKDFFEAAVGYLDEDILEEHLASKDRLKAKKRRKTAFIRLAAVAACLAAIVVAAPGLMNLFGYNSAPPDDQYARSHTEYQSYAELARVIGTDTLLENVDMGSLYSFKLILVHEPDDPDDHSAASLIEKDADGSVFGVAIYFPPYKEKSAGGSDGRRLTINGIEVEVFDYSEGKKRYYYTANFTYNECRYDINAYGDGTENVFWHKLGELLGEKNFCGGLS